MSQQQYQSTVGRSYSQGSRQNSHPYQTTQYSQYQTSQPLQGYPQGSTQTSMRRIQSNIIGEELLEALPQESIRYVEVPYVEEVVRHVPRREIVEIEKKIPKYNYEYVERVVDVPRIQYVDKQVEVPQYHEVIRYVPRREVVEVPKEIIRHVPKIETKMVEKIVDVPGDIIEVPKPYTVENKVSVPHFVDTEVPMVVAQTLKPILAESNKHVDVDVIEYEPEVISVDIHVPKAVPSQVIAMGAVDELHRVVNVPSPQYNSMLRYLNPHITDHNALPFQMYQGSVQFTTENMTHVAAMPGVHIEGWKQIERESSMTDTTTSTSRRSKPSHSARSGRSGRSGQSGTTAARMAGISASDKMRGISSTISYHNRSVVSAKPTHHKRPKGVCPC